MSVLVIGDVNVDLEILLPGRPASVVHANPDPRLFGGGSAANTAAALGRLGVPCRFAGMTGDDAFGRFARKSLDEAGVDTSAVVVTSGAPTVVVIVVVPTDAERLIYVWPPSPSAGAHAFLRSDAAVSAVAGADWLHVSGICLRPDPARGATARDALLAAMEAARESGVPVSFDLNLRLENWGWDAEFRRAVHRAVRLADVVVGSAADEIGALAGMDDPVGAAAALAGDGRLVVARLGPGGAVACSDDGVVAEPGFAVDAVDTVGAGDAFNAGLIAALRRGAGAAEALRWGNAVAALTVARRGARSTPSSAEVEALVDR